MKGLSLLEGEVVSIANNLLTSSSERPSRIFLSHESREVHDNSVQTVLYFVLCFMFLFFVFRTVGKCISRFHVNPAPVITAFGLITVLLGPDITVLGPDITVLGPDITVLVDWA